MRKDKEKSINLRRQGKSYKEIRQELGVPLATLSDWFRNQDWSNKLSIQLNDKYLIANKARIVNLNKVRGQNLKRIYNQARKEAVEEFRLLKNHPLFVSGVMIYWGEGDKASKNGFRIANSDPAMVKLFVKFLKDVCRAPEARIKASLLIYPDLDDITCLNYWSKQTGLRKNQFVKSSLIQGRSKNRKVKYGICTLYFSSRFLKEKMLVWIPLLAEYLVRVK